MPVLRAALRLGAGEEGAPALGAGRRVATRRRRAQSREGGDVTVTALRERLDARGWRFAPSDPVRIISATCPECGERQALVIARDTPPTCILCDAPLEDRRG